MGDGIRAGGPEQQQQLLQQLSFTSDIISCWKDLQVAAAECSAL
jgi:hypothetical protein